MIDKALFSHDSIEWETPKKLFDIWDDEFDFTLDPCCNQSNQKCPGGFYKEDNGLEHDWDGETVYMNPPYGEPEQPCKKNCKKKKCAERGHHITEYVPGIIDWVEKAFKEVQKLKGTVVVALLPVRTDTKWFHKWVYGKAELRFIKGRVKFVGAPSSAPFPSMLAIWR